MTGPGLRDQEGTTLIELVIASAIFLILLGGVLTMLDSGSRSERAQQARHSALLDLRGAMTRIDKDLRQALSVAPSSTTSRLDIQTLVAGAGHHIVYDVVSGEIRRQYDTSAPVVLARHVTSGEPFCFDPPDCVASSPQSPSMIRVTLALTPEVFSGGPITLATDIQLRNL